MPEIIEVSVTAGKTVQEREYEPFKIEVTAKVNVNDLTKPAEVDDALLKTAEMLQDSIDDILDARDTAMKE